MFKIIPKDIVAKTIIDTPTSFEILIPIPKKIIVPNYKYGFYLKQRNGRKKMTFASEHHTHTKQHVIMKVIVTPPTSLLLKTEKQIWDLYFYIQTDSEEVTFRIKAEDEELNRFVLIVNDGEKIFYPYKTRHENLSFILSHPNVLASIHDVHILDEHLQIHGTFVYPLLSNRPNLKLKQARIIVTNDKQQEDVFPIIHMEERGYSPAIFDFQSNIGIYHTCSNNEKLNFKFFLEVDIEQAGKIETTRSERLTWKMSRRNTKSKKQLKHPSFGKRKVAARPTKKANYLSVQISAYDLKNEMIHRLKETVIKTRRSKWVLTLYKQAFAVIGFLPKKNIIIFESFHGKQFSCSPRALYEYIKDNYTDYHLYWSVDRRSLQQFHNIDVRTVQRFTVKWLLLMPRAKYWITNSRLPGWLPKPRRTVYVQTWHGTPLKKLAADMEEVHMPATNAEKYIHNFLKEAQKWDYLISPNAYSTEIFRRAFGFTKQIIESGYPRNDYLIHNNNEKHINEIKIKHSLPLNKKVLLYAPTWRDHHYYAKGKYKFEIQLDFETLKKELSNDYVILLRLHYLIAEELDLSGFENFVFDYSQYTDIRDLYLISDILITDYSSVFFDYANLKRPIIFFAYDIDEYRDKLRGFYFNFEQEAPGPIVKTTEQLITAIQSINNDNEYLAKKHEAFFQKFCALEDGSARERVVREIFSKDL